MLAYWRFLGCPWKLATFFAATSGLIFVAPYTGDPTWDYVDAAFMSVLTFATAPWAVGIFYRLLRHKAVSPDVHMGPTWWQALSALLLWFFSASWSYDLYLLWRDGYYPVTWLGNLGASSVLYVAAGLFWNLQWEPTTGTTFAFMHSEWPRRPADSQFRRVFWPAVMFMAVTSAMVLPFIWR